mmetsp:Transcript_6050/g.13380  ORF Transcript_6050/g.13380 Transcript_6050/m.13380 type:complete len:85 (-) Transcript_6050:278-532(-)
MADGEEKGGGGGGSALCKCIRLIIGLPLILASFLVSLVFLLVWIVLLPIKCCCPALGCIVGLVEWIFENLVKLPIKLARCIVGV